MPDPTGGIATGAIISGLVTFIGGAVSNYSKQQRLREDARAEARAIKEDMDNLRRLNMRIPAMRAQALNRLRDIIAKSKTQVKDVVLGAVKKTQDRLGVDFGRAMEEASQQATQQRLGGSQAAQEMARQMLKTQVAEQKKAGETGQEQIAQAFGKLDVEQAAREADIATKFDEMSLTGEGELLKLGAAERRERRRGDRPISAMDWLLTPETFSAAGDVAGAFFQTKTGQGVKKGEGG